MSKELESQSDPSGLGQTSMLHAPAMLHEFSFAKTIFWINNNSSFLFL